MAGQVRSCAPRLPIGGGGGCCCCGLRGWDCLSFVGSFGGLHSDSRIAFLRKEGALHKITSERTAQKTL